jgi:hypothetical protein
MYLSSDFWFEDERHIVVVRVDMPDGQQSSTSDSILTSHIRSRTQ